MKKSAFAPLALAAALGFSPSAASAQIEALREREAKVKKVVTDAMPAVVALVGVQGNATGSGVIISPDGLILTAGHVTEAAGEELLIFFPDGRRAKGKSLGANRSRDAGMAKITDAGDWPYVKLGDSDALEPGQWVVAMGHPGGFDLTRTPPVRLGRVVSKGQMGMVRTDCTLVGGDSGGPLFDLGGKVVGIHSSIGGSLAENRHVPTAVFEADWDRMVAGETWGSLGMMAAGVDPDRPMLGVQMEQDENGVRVRGVLPESPALNAGLKEDDVILQIDGNNAESPAWISEDISGRKAGDSVKLKVARGEEELEFDVELVRWRDLAGGLRRRGGDRPPEAPEAPQPTEARPALGVVIDAEADADGATVYEVEPKSAAAEAGIEPGDVVVEIDGQEVGGAAAMVEAIQSRKPGDQFQIKVRRGDGERELGVTLGGE